jgi:hypothetical protein
MPWLSRTLQKRRTVLAALMLIVAIVIFVRRSRARLPPDTTVEGTYARIVLAVSEGHPRDIFAYLETEAQWGVLTTQKYRSESYALVEASYPEPERSRLLDAYRPTARAPEPPDAFAAIAADRGLIGRLRRDLSGIRTVTYDGSRATIETARGSRYTFRRQKNDIWGITLLTADLVAEAQKAARDHEVVERAAADYGAASALRAPPSP